VRQVMQLRGFAPAGAVDVDAGPAAFSEEERHCSMIGSE
jgi:hypothetical protein